ALRSSGDERALALLARELSGTPGVDTVIPFGTTLRVSGRNAEALEAALAPVRARAGFTVDAAATSLEDVFVNLMQGAGSDGAH
ncbi:MAG TPA: ABC transporter ATP-binding protein, partial [Casimicrobiaceae bacterium]|nr:ABC transporter ATP-binding protein [Casimicrobiaceae bacterium]